MRDSITARRFRMAMASAGFTMREVGAACGVSGAAVCKWMNGQSLPRSSELVLFSKATGASLDWLMCADDPFGPPFESMREEYRKTIRYLQVQPDGTLREIP